MVYESKGTLFRNSWKMRSDFELVCSFLCLERLVILETLNVVFPLKPADKQRRKCNYKRKHACSPFLRAGIAHTQSQHFLTAHRPRLVCGRISSFPHKANHTRSISLPATNAETTASLSIYPATAADAAFVTTGGRIQNFRGSSGGAWVRPDRTHASGGRGARWPPRRARLMFQFASAVSEEAVSVVNFLGKKLKMQRYCSGILFELSYLIKRSLYRIFLLT